MKELMLIVALTVIGSIGVSMVVESVDQPYRRTSADDRTPWEEEQLIQRYEQWQREIQATIDAGGTPDYSGNPFTTQQK